MTGLRRRHPANSIGRLALSLFGMLVVLLALRVVRATPYTWLGVLIGVPAVTSRRRP